MAKQEEETKGKGLVSEETKDKIKEGLESARGEIKEKLTEKAIAKIEEAIAKLEEILAYLKPHPEPYAKDAGLHIQAAIDKLKRGSSESK